MYPMTLPKKELMQSSPLSAAVNDAENGEGLPKTVLIDMINAAKMTAICRAVPYLRTERLFALVLLVLSADEKASLCKIITVPFKEMLLCHHFTAYIR